MKFFDTMRYTLLFIFLFFGLLTAVCQRNDFGPITIVIHGGAGTITRENLSPDMEKAYNQKLTEAINTGYAILENGESSVEAVIAAIRVMEDSPLFNAGKGAVFTNDGRNEMDASIMDGKTLNAGAVAGVAHVKNPIMAALAVMERSEHVMLSGAGAEEFAKSQDLEMVDPSYFYTERRYKDLQRIKEGENNKTPEKHGTVGVVALDRHGNLAAGTSTGGMTNKKWGRIGDSPIIGAGTYADNETCAVSATGHGEFFMRKVVAYNIASRIKNGEMSLSQAADYVINKELADLGGMGGVICLDREGNIAMPFNTEGMYRGYRQNGKEPVVMIYK